MYCLVLVMISGSTTRQGQSELPHSTSNTVSISHVRRRSWDRLHLPANGQCNADHIRDAGYVQ